MARSELNEWLEGLNLGADDYRTKPFQLAERNMHLHAIIRPTIGKGVSILTVADLTMNLVTRVVRHAAQCVELPAQEFSLLVSLKRQPGRFLSGIEICERIWWNNFDPGPNFVDARFQPIR